METTKKAFLYVGIASGEYAEGRRKIKKTGLPVYTRNRPLSYPGGSVQLYFALLPEYAGQSIFRKRYKRWKDSILSELVARAAEFAQRELDCAEMILAPELWNRMAQETETTQRQSIPIELLQVCLVQHRPFSQICISLPREGSERFTEQLKNLLKPYLSRMHQIIYVGRPCELSDILEEYLYEEFGMIMRREVKPVKNMLWLDLREDEERKVCGWQGIWDNKCVNSAETLKFLDTMAKNGYNTKVN